MPAPTIVGTPVSNRYGDLSVTVPSGANHLLAGAGYAHGGTPVTETISFNGDAMTAVAEAQEGPHFSTQVIFGLASPDIATGNVVAGPSGTANRAAIAFSGVDNAAPYGTANTNTGTGTAPSVTLTVGADGLAVAFLRFGGTATTVTAGTNETVRTQTMVDGSGIAIITKTGTGSVSFAPTLSESGSWVIAAVPLNGTAGATPTVASIAPTSGAIGTQITITGTNLTGTSAVSINGTACTGILNDSATQVRATIASGTTTGALALTATGGSVTGGPTFTVTAAPTLTLASPSTVRVGDTVTFTGTGLTGATALSINGTAMTSRTVLSATSISGVVASGTTTGASSVTTPNGTASGPTVTIYTPVFTEITVVNPNTDYLPGVVLLPIIATKRDQQGNTTTLGPTTATITEILDTIDGSGNPVTLTGTLTVSFVGAVATFDNVIPAATAPAGSFAQYYLTQLAAAELF